MAFLTHTHRGPGLWGVSGCVSVSGSIVEPSGFRVLGWCRGPRRCLSMNKPLSLNKNLSLSRILRIAASPSASRPAADPQAQRRTGRRAARRTRPRLRAGAGRTCSAARSVATVLVQLPLRPRTRGRESESARAAARPRVPHHMDVGRHGRPGQPSARRAAAGPLNDSHVSESLCGPTVRRHCGRRSPGASP